MSLEEFDSLTEDISKRTYNQKAYDIGNGKTRYRVHTAHKHYKDAQDKFQDIDARLTFDQTNKKWKHDKSSYSCEIPEYADEEIGFKSKYKGANIGCKFKVDASHTKGVYTETNKSGHVLYRDAFGAGIHLKIISYWRGIKRMIICDQQPTMQQIAKFDYELLLDNSADEINTDDGVWDKKTNKNFKGKKLGIKNAQGHMIYFNTILLRDSSTIQKIYPVDVELKKTGNKYHMKKNIDASIPIHDLMYPITLEI